MSFCTAINCIDGRAQKPTRQYLCKRFGVKYVDTITEPGPARLISEGINTVAIDSVLARVDISVDVHTSVGIAIVGHHDCAGNRSTGQNKIAQITKAVAFIRTKYPQLPVIGLLIDADWEVQEVVHA